MKQILAIDLFGNGKWEDYELNGTKQAACY